MKFTGSGMDELKQWVKDYVASQGGGINAWPVGSIFSTLDARDPSEILGGGTWTRLAEGTMLMSAGDTYEAGSTGGEATHTLTTAEMPSHSHAGSTGSVQSSHTHSNGIDVNTSYMAIYGTNSHSVTSVYHAMGQNGAGKMTPKTSSAADNHSHTLSIGSAGSGQAHNNLPPYLAVYIWQRTA